MRGETLVTGHPASKFGRRRIQRRQCCHHALHYRDGRQAAWGGYATRHSDRRYVTGVFNEIMSQHGSLFETLVDVVMRARQQYKDDVSAEERGGWGGSYPSHSPPIVELESNNESFLHLRLLMQLLCNHYTA